MLSSEEKSKLFVIRGNHPSLLRGKLAIFTLVLHKTPAQNRCAASIAASKTLYSKFYAIPGFTMGIYVNVLFG